MTTIQFKFNHIYSLSVASLSELSSVQVWLVAWDTGGAVKLNAQVVSVHLNAEEAVFTPVGTP